MNSTDFLLLCGVILIAPHLSERSATWISIVIAFIVFVPVGIGMVWL